MGWSVSLGRAPRAARTTSTVPSTSSSTVPSVAPSRRSATSSATGAVPGRSRTPRSVRRTNRTGSARVISSTIAMPAGTRTSQRRTSVCSDRAASHASGSPITSATAPASQRSSARSNGPDTMPAATTARATGTGARYERGRDAQRMPPLVAVRDRVGGGERDCRVGDEEHGRERADDRAGGRERRRVARGRDDDAEHRERRRDDPDRGDARRAGREQCDEAGAPGEPEEGRGDDTRRLGATRRARPSPRSRR